MTRGGVDNIVSCWAVAGKVDKVRMWLKALAGKQGQPPSSSPQKSRQQQPQLSPQPYLRQTTTLSSFRQDSGDIFGGKT